MDNQIPEDPYRILAHERSHEDARQTVTVYFGRTVLVLPSKRIECSTRIGGTANRTAITVHFQCSAVVKIASAANSKTVPKLL
jgi:hypothetical protein